MDNAKNLLLLFERPQEPVFLPKGDKKKKVINAPTEFLNEKHKTYITTVVSRLGESNETVPVPKISIPPMDEFLVLKRDEAFSLFIDKHRALAGKLINLFLSVKTVGHLMAVGVYAREHLNPQLFSYAFAVALRHRPDTKDLPIPSVVHSFPDKFVENRVIGRAREEVTIVPEENRTPIEIPKDFTASDLDEEHRLHYFREDIGVNLHHWYWHQVYPGRGPRQVIDKDRRGELFFYMHQQIIARYNCERLANSLKRVARLTEWSQPIKEAYFPKLDRLISKRSYAGRVANAKLQNLARTVDDSFVDVQQLEHWRDTILDAINKGVVVDRNNREVPLDEFGGIDILGNIIEATELSINPQLYGNLHNQGHNMISLIHDPDHRHLEEPGVMGDVATAMRDPIFYRWHAFIDSILQKFKATLPRYTEAQLNYPGIEVTGVEISTENAPANTLNTFWQKSDVNIANGLDFQKTGDIFVRVTHLQHQLFTYQITVDNASGRARSGTCRIFLAPKQDERGNPWQFQEQRTMFMELDKFKVDLTPGSNRITRMSTQSSVTIPFERTYRDVAKRPTDDAGIAEWNFCGCGWPQNMLVPRGKQEGMPMELFVMISNYDDDRVDVEFNGRCDDAYSFCGLKDRLYPDRRSMGYPFDRQARDGVKTLQEFLTPNMRVTNVNVKFTNRVFMRQPK
ncbi:hypothetical protein NQ315_015906 [Exocentrus adspersus]|uniref:Tyrosinase copper-binding domain-containing protein n=1 Tax=Exocentrus adspersus TaxID=1586481 RepID=A0AAV8W3S6_9CUCU|nr:hypothetical protein NQ315_015906 [Exocentrus adspersus]